MKRVAILLAGLILLAGTPAQAATGTISVPQRIVAAMALTAPTAASFRAWDAARRDQAAWADYDFDWTTDYCTIGPDQPFGFDFRLPCARHDFGYRTFKALGVFAEHKARVDDAFFVDLTATCAGYRIMRRIACVGLAYTYYQAVKTFGVA